jgi:hypothetical protein
MTPKSVEILGKYAFAKSPNLVRVDLPEGDRLEVISVLCGTGIWNIPIPGSVEEIKCLLRCRNLETDVFGWESHLKIISGFCDCVIQRVCLPKAVVTLRKGALRSKELRLLILDADSRLVNIERVKAPGISRFSLPRQNHLLQATYDSTLQCAHQASTFPSRRWTFPMAGCVPPPGILTQHCQALGVLHGWGKGLH